VPDAEEPSIADTMRLFRGRSTIAQMLFFFGSLLVWGVVFAAILETAFGPSGAATATRDGYRARMLAGLCASMVVGIYYAIGFLYGFGGPFWNPVLSALLGVVTPSLTLPLLVADAPNPYTPNPVGRFANFQIAEGGCHRSLLTPRSRYFLDCLHVHNW